MADKKNVDDAVHWAYPTTRLARYTNFKDYDSYWKFVVVRDPVRRLPSAFSNRVVHNQDQYRGRLARTRARLLGLSLEPDINTFFFCLTRYRLQSGRVRHHTDRVEHYIGTHLSQFDAIYPIESLDQLAVDLGVRIGKPVCFPRLQTGGPIVSVNMLSKAAFHNLMTYLRPEYELLSQYYMPPVYGGQS